MRRIVRLGLAGAVLAAAPDASAQRYIRHDEKVDYTLVVEGESPEQTASWWKPFLANHNQSGYCFELPTMPLVDRPALGGPRSRCRPRQ